MTCKKILIIPILILFLSSCDLYYEPSYVGDTSDSPCSKVDQYFRYRETVTPPYSAEDLNKTLTLGQLLDIALCNNPATRASWNAARAAAFGYHVSLSEYYPTIDYAMDVQDQDIYISKEPAASTTTTNGNIIPTVSRNYVTLYNEFTLSYLLLDFGGRYGNASLAFETLIQANWSHNYVMQEVMLQVITAYTSYISNKSLVIASEKDVQDAEVAVQAAVATHKWGVATQTDVLSAQATLEQMRYNLQQAIGAQKTAAANLLIALGLPVNTCISVESLPQKLPVIDISKDIDCLIELAKQRNPLIGIAIAEVKEQEAQLLISYSSGMPVVTLTGSASRTNYINPTLPYVDNGILAFNINAPIFAGYFYVNQLKERKAQIAQAVANLDMQVNEVISNVVTNYYAFTTAEAQLPSSAALLEYSERSYRGTLSQYKVGVSSILDALNALTILSNARAQEIANRTQWAFSLANLAFAVGILGDDSGTWKDAPPQKLYQIKYKDKVPENDLH